MQPFQYICRQPRSPLNPLLFLGKWLQARCKGVLSRIRLIITQQGSEKVSIGDAPMGGPASTACAGARTREMHGCVGVTKQLRLTSMWDWIRMCLWSCASGCVRWQGFPWRRHSKGGLTLQEEKQWFIHLLHTFHYLLTRLQLFLPLPVQVIDFTNHCEIGSSLHV